MFFTQSVVVETSVRPVIGQTRRMPRSNFAKPVNVALIATLFFIVQNCGQIFANENEPTPAKPLAELQREVDELLAKKDPVQLRHREALIFELAERLRSESEIGRAHV